MIERRIERKGPLTSQDVVAHAGVVGVEGVGGHPPTFLHPQRVLTRSI
jgi:hypothetical protein